VDGASAAVRSWEPVLLRSIPPETEELLHSFNPGLELGSVMIIPLAGNARPAGSLSVGRRPGRDPFTNADLAMTIGFANSASVAVELAMARADHARVAVLEDRDRIARDLHDHVIQQLFATGLSLEALANRQVGDSALANRIRGLGDDLDRTIRQIRTSIFQLRGSLATSSEGQLRAQVLQIAAEFTIGLGFSPSVMFAGPIDVAVNEDLTDDAAACVREALANVAKHARARSAQIEITVSADDLLLQVRDDGIGLTESNRMSGLANLRMRAVRRGGSFGAAARPEGGTELIWKVPLT
jgi:signal transduction histidine kinase